MASVTMPSFSDTCDSQRGWNALRFEYGGVIFQRASLGVCCSDDDEVFYSGYCNGTSNTNAFLTSSKCTCDVTTPCDVAGCSCDCTPSVLPLERPTLQRCTHSALELKGQNRLQCQHIFMTACVINIDTLVGDRLRITLCTSLFLNMKVFIRTTSSKYMAYRIIFSTTFDKLNPIYSVYLSKNLTKFS